jgi:hypothetical protein
MFKPEGGHKRGHSNMEHWDYTAEVKAAASLARRQLDKKLVTEGLNEAEAAKEN